MVEPWVLQGIASQSHDRRAEVSHDPLGMLFLRGEIDRLKKENAELRAEATRVPPYHWLGADAESVA